MPLPSARAGPARLRPDRRPRRATAGPASARDTRPFQGAPPSRCRIPHLINTRRPEHVNPPPDAQLLKDVKTLTSIARHRHSGDDTWFPWASVVSRYRSGLNPASPSAVDQSGERFSPGLDGWPALEYVAGDGTLFARSLRIEVGSTLKRRGQLDCRLFQTHDTPQQWLRHVGEGLGAPSPIRMQRHAT